VIFRLSSLVDLELQFYSFALACFVGKLWWTGPLCSFSSLGTVSIVRCWRCLYWAFRFIPFPLTCFRVLFTLLFLCFHSCCSTKILSTSLPPSFYSFWLLTFNELCTPDSDSGSGSSMVNLSIDDWSEPSSSS
jgi:hypothetical protein